MKVLILAGGYGTRLGRITEAIPKPMLKVGSMPIIWHIMRRYAHYGHKDFIISLGYKSEMIKEYFLNYSFYNNDFSVDLGENRKEILSDNNGVDWKVTLIDTGLDTLKGARIKRLEKYLDDVNMVTYGDCVADIDINRLLEFHASHDKAVTLTGVRPPSRFGELKVKDTRILEFEEKPQTSAGLINGGYMVFNRKLLEYLSTDESCDLETKAFGEAARDDEMRVYTHDGQWACVDTERDLNHLSKLWRENEAFWRV